MSDTTALHTDAPGRIASWNEDRATSSGLDGVAQGSLVDIDGSGPALVTALGSDYVELAPLSTVRPRPRAEVRSLGPLAIPSGQSLVGRTVDCLGRPLGGRMDAETSRVVPIFARDPMLGTSHRPGRLTIGTLVFDLQRVIDLGTSLLALGSSDLTHHVMRHQVLEGRICIIATTTTAATEPYHVKPQNHDTQCIHVTMGAHANAAAQWLVPWTAMAAADSLRKDGYDVVVLLDGLDAWRPLADRFPERGTWLTQLAQLASRAYPDASGSVSLICRTNSVEEAPDAFDEVLDLRRAQRGDIEPRATKLVRPPIRVPDPRVLGAACAEAARLRAHEHAAPASVPHSQLSRAMRVRACLRHRPDVTDTTEQIICLLAIWKLDELTPDAVDSFVQVYVAELRRRHADRLVAIRQRKQLNRDDEQIFLELASQIALARRE